MIVFKPIGRRRRKRNPGWPLKKLLEAYNHKAETGNLFAIFVTRKKKAYIRKAQT
jgi:hypothetical protein